VRRAYAERRTRLAAALARALPEGRVEGAAAGVHLVLALPDRIDEQRLADATAAQGVRAGTVGALRRRPHEEEPTRLVLGYGRIPAPGVDAAVARLAAAVRAARG
jgi:GntR family transcriptional regulator/MocR family aminotransferase